MYFLSEVVEKQDVVTTVWRRLKEADRGDTGGPFFMAWWLLCGAGSLSHTYKGFIESVACRVPREAGMPAVANIGTGRFSVFLFMRGRRSSHWRLECMVYGMYRRRKRMSQRCLIRRKKDNSWPLHGIVARCNTVCPWWNERVGRGESCSPLIMIDWVFPRQDICCGCRRG